MRGFETSWVVSAPEPRPPEKSTTRSRDRRDGAGDTLNYCGIIKGFQ